ncbi:unnamed protein product [Cylindrotheca closterium]|uniref:Uncharacterized protein n=1 Tax=Cylindrotheca closterium TaxID=2856 RepID=A0AAD2FZ15_9STRA|nr:unnamed protein product [Cylindrotheca closterium]
MSWTSSRRAIDCLSISSHFSPQQLINNVNINYKSDMVAELGQYVHAIGTDSNNSMEPQSIKAIYIEPTKGTTYWAPSAQPQYKEDDFPTQGRCTTQRFGDYESDDNSGDEGNEEEEPIVAHLDHHHENVDRGTDDIGNLVTGLEDLQEPPEDEIVFEPEETPPEAKVTRSGQTYAQAAMSGLNLSQVPKKPREWPSSRSANKNKNRVGQDASIKKEN